MKNDRASASIDSKTSRKRNAQRAIKDPPSPFDNADDDNFSQSSQSKQRHQWANDACLKEEDNDEESESLATGAPTALLAIDDDQEHLFRSVAPASAQKGMQQLLEYDVINQSAASSSSN